jgi:hypothetical protein
LPFCEAQKQQLNYFNELQINTTPPLSFRR